MKSTNQDKTIPSAAVRLDITSDPQAKETQSNLCLAIQALSNENRHQFFEHISQEDHTALSQMNVAISQPFGEFNRRAFFTSSL